MFKRFRRLRMNATLRSLVRETHLSMDDFIYPLFVKSGEGIKKEISSMPGVYQMSLDEILKECGNLQELGINSIILFGIPEVKDSVGSDALCEHGIIASAVKAGNFFKFFIAKEFTVFATKYICSCAASF